MVHISAELGELINAHFPDTTTTANLSDKVVGEFFMYKLLPNCSSYLTSDICRNLKMLYQTENESENTGFLYNPIEFDQEKYLSEKYDADEMVNLNKDIETYIETIYSIKHPEIVFTDFIKPAEQKELLNDFEKYYKKLIHDKKRDELIKATESIFKDWIDEEDIVLLLQRINVNLKKKDDNNDKTKLLSTLNSVIVNCKKYNSLILFGKQFEDFGWLRDSFGYLILIKLINSSKLAAQLDPAEAARLMNAEYGIRGGRKGMRHTTKRHTTKRHTAKRHTYTTKRHTAKRHTTKKHTTKGNRKTKNRHGKKRR